MRPAPLLLVPLLFSGGCTTGPEPDRDEAPINAFIGDTSFEATYGRHPNASDEEWTRIVTHLRFVEAELRARDVSHLPYAARQARVLNLQRLHEYWTAGLFPRNRPGTARTPRFVEPAAPALVSPRRVCAVGALAEADLGAAAIDGIGAKYTFNEIHDIHDPAFLAWAKGSGLSLDELAMIQPTYDFENPEFEQHKRHVQDVLASREGSMNACVHSVLSPRERHPATLVAFVQVDGRGNASRATIQGTDDPRIRACGEKVLKTTRFQGSPGVSGTSGTRSYTITGPRLPDGGIDPGYPPVVLGRAKAAVDRCGTSLPATPAGQARVMVKTVFFADGTIHVRDVSFYPAAEANPSARVSACVLQAIEVLDGPQFLGDAKTFEFVYLMSTRRPPELR
jgi:hypothetical protein